MTASISRPKRPFHLSATIGALALAALVVPAGSSANHHKAPGVRAEVKGGTLEVTGSRRADSLALRLKAGDPTQVQVDVGDDGSGDFSFARSQLRVIEVKAGGGDDSVRIDDANGAVNDTIPTTIAGGRGDDSLKGGQGAETFEGGRGNDAVIGGRANDTADLGSGNDSFRWDPGDGSDVIDGQRGRDTMLFNGAAVNEDVTLSANGSRLKFFRNVANITMDTAGVENVDFNALGGTDNITVGDLTGTDVRHVNLDLAGTLGGSAGDGALDNVLVTGTNRNDSITVQGTGSGADVSGLATAVSLKHADPIDRLTVNTLAGADRVLVQGVAGVLQVLVVGTAV
jgi:Ca2+-binding RTX toxin-like protein